MKRRKNILKQAGVLLIAAILILMTLFVFTPIIKVVKASSIMPLYSFEDWTGPSPPSWTTTILVGSYNWEPLGTGGVPSRSPHTGLVQAYFNSYYAYTGSMARLSYDINLAFDYWHTIWGYTDFKITFWMYHDLGYSGSTDSVSVQIDIDDGSGWNTVGLPIYRYDGSTGWKPHIIDLSDYYDKSNVHIAFLAYSNYGNSMSIDDVEITGIENAPPNMPSSPNPGDLTSVDPCCSPICFSWTGGDPDGDPVTYDVWFDSGTGTLAQVATVPSATSWCPPDGFLSGKTYQWKIIAHDDHGYTTTGPVWRFSTPASVLQITSVYVNNNDVKVDVKNTDAVNTISGVIVRLKFIVGPNAPCGCCGGSSTLTGTGLVFHSPNTYIKAFPPLTIGPGATVTKSLTIHGCACFLLIVTVDACGATPPSGIIQETRHGSICDLNIW